MSTAAIKSRAPRLEVIDEYPLPDQGTGLFVVDVSRTGARVRTRNLAPVGAQIDVTCTLVDDDLYTVKGIADVVRRDALHGEMGLRFVWLTPESKAVISELEQRRETLMRSRRRRRAITRR